MKKIALTMRITESEFPPSPDGLRRASGELRDSIAQDWPNFLHSIGIQAVLVPNDPNKCADYLKEAGALILTGGDDIILKNPSDSSGNPKAVRDSTEYTLISYAIEKNIPVLGVCRGMQLINYYFGGTLKPVKGHVAKEHGVEITETAQLFPEGKMKVNSFHNLGIDKLGKGLSVFAKAPDGTVEGFVHENIGVTGIVWHPERAFSDHSAKKLNEEFVTKLLS